MPRFILEKDRLGNPLKHIATPPGDGIPDTQLKGELTCQQQPHPKVSLAC